MITIDKVTAESFNKNYILVQWSIKDTDEDLTPYKFSVLRSGAPKGKTKTVAKDLSNTFQHFDKTVNLFSKWRKIYYKIKIKNAVTGEEIISEPAIIEEPRGADLILLEIRRRNEELLLPRFVGTRAAIFIAKTFGQKCPDCWDGRKFRRRSSNCLTCFNTNYVGGYFDQCDSWINLSPPAEVSVVQGEMGEYQPHLTSIWTGHFPQLSPRDVIVEQTGRRWRVVDINFTEKRRVKSHQIIRAKEIATGEVGYKIPVNEIKIPTDPSGFVGFYPGDGSGLL